MDIGILGTGHIGGALAKLLVRAGHDVVVGSRHASEHNQLAHDLSELGEGRVESLENAMAHGTVVIEALPHGVTMALDEELLAGKLLVSASNYYPERDGEIDHGGASETEALQRRLPHARVAKAFNMMAEREFVTNFNGRKGDRLAILFAASDEHEGDIATIRQLIEDAGFDPVRTGGLATSFAFQPNTPPYGANWTGAEAREKLRLES